MLGWLPDRVAAFIAQSVTRGTLLGIDENTALVLTDAWRKYGRGKVHVLRGSLDFEE
jgi:cyanophycinase